MDSLRDFGVNADVSLAPFAVGLSGESETVARPLSCATKRIPVAGLGPAIHVFGAEIVAGSRRGCPGQARARGYWNKNSRRNTRPSAFPGQPCLDGEGLGEGDAAELPGDRPMDGSGFARISLFQNHRMR